MKAVAILNEMSDKLPPNTVVFDLGKVLVDFDYQVAARNFQSACKISMPELLSMLDHSPLLYRYETAEITTEEFYNELRNLSGYTGNFDVFCRTFSDIFMPIEPMIELHGLLRQNGVPSYIFSNTNPLAVEHIRREFPFFADFDGYILSCEHRAMKPDQRLYEVVERISGRAGSDILYIDDRAENVAAGAARGWHAILHQSPEATRAAVVRAGLIPQEQCRVSQP